MNKKFDVRKLVQISLLIALQIILTRFCSIQTPIVRIGFGFVPVVIIASMYGPISAGVANGIADIIGALLIMGKGFLGLLPTRIVKELIMIPINVIIIGIVWKNIIVKLPKFSKVA